MVAPILHELKELPEQVSTVMRARSPFRMILDREDGSSPMRHPLHGIIVEIDVGDTEVRGVGNLAVLVFHHRKSMVLGGDLHAARIQVPDGVIPPVVAEGKLKSPGPESPCNELMAQADPEHRGSRFRQAQNRVLGFFHGSRVARAVGDEEAVGLLP